MGYKFNDDYNPKLAPSPEASSFNKLSQDCHYFPIKIDANSNVIYTTNRYYS
jgi:hypothetical protein